MIDEISPYLGLAAAGFVLVMLAVDRHLRASRARALAVRLVPVEADITCRLPVMTLALSDAVRVVPPLPPAAYRRRPMSPQPPLRRGCRPPDRPAHPRGEARLITPWGDVTRLPGTDEPGIVPSTLGAAATAR
ncbi:MAG: hypothetical protein R2761_09045 [Acidimicrobiales bacterium]